MTVHARSFETKIFLPKRDFVGNPALGRSLGRLMEILDRIPRIDGCVPVSQEER